MERGPREDAVKVVLASLPAFGHLYPLVPLALALERAGATVVFATGEEFASRLPARTVQVCRAIEDLRRCHVRDRTPTRTARRGSGYCHQNRSRARKAEADGEATYIEQTGRARGAEIEAVGLARAKGFEAQKNALGPETTAMVNVISELAKSPNRIVPDILVNGSNGAGDVISAGLMGILREFQRHHGAPPRG